MPYYSFTDCGAGETEKIYEVPATELENILKNGYTFAALKDINSIVAADNEEKFDFVILNQQSMEDYFKLRMPLTQYGILKFTLKIEYDYEGNNYIHETENMFIANSEDADKWWTTFDDMKWNLYGTEPVEE